MKNLIKLLLLLLALLRPATALAYDFEVDCIYYNINGNEATVTRSSDWEHGEGYTSDVTIPATVTYNGTTYSVTSIGEDAFNGCSGLTSVTIPNSVTTINDYAFCWCSGLTSIDIPNSVKYIGELAFKECSSLTNITIPNAVTSIGSSAFAYCSGLASLSIGNSVTTIGQYAFNSCSGLAAITVASGNTVYDSRDNCNAIIETASNKLIAGCKNTVIPNSVTSIGECAFWECSGLTSIDIPNSVITISSCAFALWRGLTSVTIPNSVTTIGECAFTGCSGLNEVYSYIIDINDITMGTDVFSIYNGDYSARTLYVPYGTSAAYQADRKWSQYFGSIVEMEPQVISFADANVKALCVQNWDSDGDGELSEDEAAAVTNIGTVFKSNNTITSFDELQYFTGLTDITAQAFASCKNLTSTIIPDNVTTIGNGAFSYCSGLTSIDIPNAVTSIGSSAFAYCNGLSSVSIGNSVTTIGQNAFISCSGLATITVAGGNTVYDSRDNCNAMIETASNTLLLGCKNTVIPNTVTDIGYAAFRSSGLTSITIPHSVTHIGEWAFGNCTGLTAIDIPNSVQTIYNSAFNGCSGLTSVNIPSSVTSLCYCAFNGCTALTDVYSYITDISSIYIGSSVFNLSSQDYADRTLHVPYGTLAAYQAEPKWSQYFEKIVEIGNEIAESIELDKTAAVVIEGETMQLTAMVFPGYTYNKTVVWASSNPMVATVDENGLVTGVSVGSSTITAMTTDGSNLSASCQVTVKSLSTDNCFSMPDCEVLHGESITIPIQLNNTENIMAFQTDLYLPEGFSLVTDEDDEPIIMPSSRLTDDHIIMAEYLNDGGVRILCYNTSEQIISGNEGDMFYITVNAPDDAAGDYAIYLRNSRLTNMDYNEIRIPDAGAVLTVNTFIPGDVNDSHNVNVTDIVVAAQYVLQRNPSPFIFDAADMNGDGEVTVTDIMLIARLILYPTMMNAPRQAPALVPNDDRMSGESISLQPGETRKVSIALDNEMDYAAFQLDLNLPDGLMASNFELTNRAGNHAFDVEAIGNGKTRILCYSPTIEVIAGNSGALLTFDVIALAPIAGDITIDGIEMVTTTCQPVLLDAFNIGVNAQTAVNELTTGKTIARVDYYNVAGQRVDRPESGVTLVVTTYTDGTRTTTKLIH